MPQRLAAPLVLFVAATWSLQPLAAPAPGTEACLARYADRLAAAQAKLERALGRPMPLQPLQPNVQRQLAVEAQRMYELNCTICHAPDGKGIRQSVPSLVQSFTEADRQRLMNAVLFGSESGAMPSFGYLLSPRDASQVLNHSIIKLAEAPIAPFGADEIACSLGSPPPISK